MGIRNLLITLAVIWIVGCSQISSPTTPSTAASPGIATTTAAFETRAAAKVAQVHGAFERGSYVGSGEPPVVTVHTIATGEASHVGRFTIDSTHRVSFITLLGEGTADLTTPSGDRITTTLDGRAEPMDGGVFHIVETLTITGGTGRFAGASGQLVIDRLSFPEGPANGSTSGTIDGTLILPRSVVIK